MQLELDEKRKASLLAEWEGLCDPSKGCKTDCCFYEGSPCVHLEWIDEEKKIGRCSIYEHRFDKCSLCGQEKAQHKTVDGKVFQIVPMWVRLQHTLAPEKCGYSKIISIQGKKVFSEHHIDG